MYIVGGTSAVSRNVENAIKGAGIKILGRFSGATAIETSAMVADYGVDSAGMSVDNIGVATTSGYWDALSGAAFCGKLGSVLILVDGPDASSIFSVVSARSGDIEHGHVFGGSAAVSHATFNKLLDVCPDRVDDGLDDDWDYGYDEGSVDDWNNGYSGESAYYDDEKYGWYFNEDRPYYLDNNGDRVTGSQVIDGNTYFFDDNGYLVGDSLG